MTQAIENLLREERAFPLPEFAAAANAQPGIHETAEAGLQGFWLRNALERVSWFKEPTVALDDSNPPFYRWFTDGTLNLSYNCLDRHLEERGDKVAYHWVGEPGDTRTSPTGTCTGGVPIRQRPHFARGGTRRSCRHLHGDGPRAAGGDAGLRPDRRRPLGGVRRVLLRLAGRPDRRRSGQGAGHPGRRLARGNVVPLKANADVAVARTPSIEHVVVVRRVGSEVAMEEGRDLWWDELVAGQPDIRARRAGRRGHALHPLHLGDDRPAQGDSPHPGRLPGGTVASPTTTCSISSPTTSTGAPPTSAG